MQADVTLALEADHGDRRLVCHVQDFFGDWVIAFRRGRHGGHGRRQIMSATSLERAWDIVLRRLIHYHGEALRRGAVALVLDAVPDMSIPAWAKAPLQPWSRFA